VQKAAELKPDAIILDLAMPEMDGLHAAREILGYSGACRSHIPRSNRSSVPRQTDHAFRGMPIRRSEVKPIRNLRLSE
jgi:CheY-like chemotaxis protein